MKSVLSSDRATKVSWNLLSLQITTLLLKPE